MKFQVPQFIEEEDKILGPLTLKQSLFIGVAAGFVIFLYFYSSRTALIILGGPVTAFAFSMAFLKVNGMPFIYYLQNYFNFSFKNTLYTWQKKEGSPLADKMQEADKIVKKYEAEAGKENSAPVNAASLLNISAEEEDQK